MAHLPEAVEDIDEALSERDPVVRMPKRMVPLPPPPPLVARRTVLSVAAMALVLGGALGAVGIGIVYATHRGTTAAAPRRARSRLVPRAAAGADGTVIPLITPAGDPSAPPGAGATRGPDQPPPSPYLTAQQRLGRGRTLPAVLRALQIRNDLAGRVLRALHGLVNMRALQPGDVIAVMRDPAASNEVRRVEYRRSPTQVWAVSIAPDGSCRGEQIEVVQSSVQVVAGFRVDGPLAATVRAAGLQSEIIERLQEIFPLLDLGQNFRRGDTLRMIVQEERLNGSFFRYGRVEAIEYRGAMGRRRAFFVALGAHTGDFFDAQGFTRERGPLRAPVNNPRLTSPFNLHRMHPVLHREMPHLGCDFAAPAGDPVYAAAEGTVLSAGNGGPAGNLVRLAHPALSIETGYAHLSQFAPGIRAGTAVRQRQLIGYVGTTGRSTGPHLHFSVKRAGHFVDPLQFYGGRRSVPAALRTDFDQRVAQLGAQLDAIQTGGGDVPAVDAPDAGAAEPAATTDEGALEATVEGNPPSEPEETTPAE